MALMEWNLRETLERVANQKTTRPPPENANVVEIASLDKLKNAIRDLNAKIIQVDTEEHKVELDFQARDKALADQLAEQRMALRTEIEGKAVAIEARRSDLRTRMTRLQMQLIEALKDCGIYASLPERKEG